MKYEKVEGKELVVVREKIPYDYWNEGKGEKWKEEMGQGKMNVLGEWCEERVESRKVTY